MSQSKWMEGPFSDRAPLKVTATRRKTVVLVCMVDSIHVARWIAQFDPTEVKFILFPSGPNRRVHPKIVEMIERGKEFDNQMTLVPFGGKLSLPLWALDRFFSDRIRGLLLRRVLKKVEPNFVHALEFQHAGYVTIRALEDKSIKTPFIATNYGSDIYWFQRFPRHRKKIRRLLERANYYSAECSRDYFLARALGFSAKELPVIPNAGGLPGPKEGPDLEKPELKQVIAIKGYQGWAGRALVALRAIEELSEELLGLEMVFYSTSFKVAAQARQVARRTGLRILTHRKGSLRHEEVMEILSRSKIYVGLSRTDGISTSLLEAMAMGAFPIQTSTSCANEWVLHEKTAILIDEINVATVKGAIRRALQIVDSSDQARRENSRTIRDRCLDTVINQKARLFYFPA